ncbi:AT-hook motif nuclear-localized protein 28-like [Vicia villosa]|uniref:AT-hook motif nuclear-localized protein 28-like n=1 Tax=Vicia villosa TaxID=3911 RepID=UPI00273CCE29|nr:AT-hook motif nuclear-localized protein 28-like [Vicia villosa]
MEHIVIEIPQGRDVVKSLINLARSRQAGLTVLSGSGLVSDVTFLFPETRVIGFPVEGPFNIISLTGTYINPYICQASPSLLNIASSNSYFSIFVSNGDEGHVYGGIVKGKIMAASKVLITAALIKNPNFHRFGNVGGSLHEMPNDRLQVINNGRLEDESNNFTNTYD